MSFKSRIDAGLSSLAAVVALAGILIYYDRRETIALGADDHIAVNRVAQMIDPWPRYVADKNIAFNGERAQSAVERYRRDCAFQPINPATTSLALQQTAAQAAAARCQAQNQAQTQAVSQGASAAPVK
jgi:hypothetical protein